ncbi:rod-determining factor RdfA [Natrinema gelatinilyticum]|uniref:rod-determining factor RdfA n=1 Tax=Natrinema gelatinilyticum TaxID=2961571 RepID=UPI0020C302FB|nr:rod-determining factor RdfA [Natrinema gelatinilyticum]
MGCKVDRLMDRYELTVPSVEYNSLDEYLVQRWTGVDGRESEGYKPLTRYFNKQVLNRVYEKNGRDTMAAHLDREYELIVGGDAVERDELAADLSTDDLNIDEITDNFISWSTMRHHLKGCLEAEKGISSAKTEWERNSVDMAKDRTAEKAQSALSSLTSKGKLPEAERATVDVQVKLSCPECSVRVPFEDAVERGYVCEAHFETQSNENVTDRISNQLSTIALPFSLVEAMPTLVFEDLYLLDALTVVGF